MLELYKVRSDFPILQEKIHGKPLVYLDNAATTQRPNSVVAAIRHFYETDNSNIHRAVHKLSERATEKYEGSRVKISKAINAAKASEIIFVRGTTEAINLVASSFRSKVKAGDEILITHMEHHSNIVPWQMLCTATGAILKVVPVNDKGELDLAEFDKLLSVKTKMFALTHISNVLGTINPIKELVKRAHAINVPVLVDGAQGLAHLKVDVQDLDCDFYAFSGHKMYGPMGIGVLYGKTDILNSMPPYQGGGDMIQSVSFEKTTYNVLPYKFEAGTPNVPGVIGLGAAVDYIESLGYENIQKYEEDLLHYATESLLSIPDLKIIGTADQKASVISFVLGDIHAHDLGTILDKDGIAIRTGHHCTQPLMERFGVPATARISLAVYNTTHEIDAAVSALKKAKEIFAS